MDDSLKYFPTPQWVRDEMYEAVKIPGESVIIDLGAGMGQLAPIEAIAASDYFAVELDKSMCKKMRDNGVRVHQRNILSRGVADLAEGTSMRNIFVSNPPYGTVLATTNIRDLLSSQCVSPRTRNYKTARMEQIFLARVLEASKAGDMGAFIVPRTLLERNYAFDLREALLNKHGLCSISMLPSGVFSGTDVQAMIVWFRPHSGHSKDGVVLRHHASQSAVTLDEDVFLNEGAIIAPSRTARTTKVLGDSLQEIQRGNIPSAELRRKGVPHIHTSEISTHHSKTISSGVNCKAESGVRVARDGDILIARVGSRVVGKAAILTGGDAPISDCVIRIRVPMRSRKKVFESIVSEAGQRWIKAVSSGSCAKYITQSTLSNMPLYS